MTDKKGFNIRPGAILELANMYEDELAFVRELVSNILDQLRHPNAKGKEAKATIYFYRLSRRIVVVDELTGIMDMEDFTAIGTENASRESGKVVGDEVNSYANINPEIRGQKHFGKLSCLKASRIGQMEIYSNNGQNGHYLKADYTGWDTFDYGLPFKTLDKSEALSHVGLKVAINDVKDEVLSVRKLENAVKKWFKIVLKKGKVKVEIIDVDNANKTIEVEAPDGFVTKGETTDDSLKMSRGGNIRVNLKPLDKPSIGNNIDVYQKEIYVKSIRMPYMCEGYVNWDGLELGPNRETYMTNAEFNDKLTTYLAKNFEEDKIDEQPPIRKKEFEHLIQVATEVFSAIQMVDASLSVDLFGPQSDTGVKGIVTSGKNKGDEYKEKKNTQILNDAIESAMPIIFTGDDGPVISCGGPDGGGGSDGDGNTRRITDGGPYSIKTKEEGDEQKQKFVMPDIEPIHTPQGDAETLRFMVLQKSDGKNKLLILLNASKPACRVLTKVSGLDKLRDMFADKMIRAAYRLKYKANDIEEFEQKVDQTWNALYLIKGANK